jgi:hypothetical protein
MFFLLLQRPLENLINRVRRLRKRGFTNEEQIFNDYIVKKHLVKLMNLIEELGFLAKVKLIAETEKADIIKYLEEASYVLNWKFVNDFVSKCVPHQLTEEDLFYLHQCTDRTLEETEEGPL